MWFTWIIAKKKKEKKIHDPLNEIKMLRYVERDYLNNLNFCFFSFYILNHDKK